jgi:AraC family transcriptional regulator
MQPSAFPTDARRAEYAARFNRVVDHIQTHLDEPLDLATLAAVACFSPCHFHRLFHGWMRETIHEFIVRLRLERAAKQLSYNPGKTVTEIALDCGFASPSTFARAFKAFHGVSASQWRLNHKIGKTDRKDWQAEEAAAGTSWDPAPRSGRPKETAMPLPFQVAVKQLPPMHVAYLRHVGPFQGNPALFERLFGQLCAWAGPRGLLGPDTRFVSVYPDSPEITDADKLRLDVAITVAETTQVDGAVGKQWLPGGAYAVARVRIHVQQYAETWDALMGDWLPSSGYQPDDRPCYEFTLNDPKTDPEGMHDVEICMAVKPL